MAPSHVVFADLKAGRVVQRIVARLLRFWETRNVKKGGELMGIDLLLLDEKSTMMQGSIHVQQLPKFQQLLTEGTLYVITGFEVTRSNTRFKIIDFKKSIRITQSTAMEVLDESFCVIPKEFFRFRTHDQLLALSNTNKELPDVIGQICSTKAYQNEASQKMDRMMVHLRHQSGEKVRFTAFDSQATILHRRLEKKEGGTCVLLATSINPKFFGGELYLNATSGTHYYFDTEIGVTRAFAESNRTITGLQHLKTAADGSYVDGIYLYGILMMCKGQMEEGRAYLDKLGWQQNKANADRCWRNIKKSFHGVRVRRLPIYMETIRAMRPTIMCNVNDLHNTCAHCYYYKQMVKFVLVI